MRLALTVAVLVLNVWALASVLGSRTGAGQRIGWLLGITFLPVVGALAWIVLGRRTLRTASA